MIGTFSQSVPAPDAPQNEFSHQVIGNKTDAASEAATASIVALLRAAGVRLTDMAALNPTSPLPNLDAAVQLLADAAGWTYGLYAQIDDGAGTPAFPFKIVAVVVGATSAADEYQIEIASGAGAAEVPACEVAFTGIGADNSVIIPCETPVIAAGTRIAARVACLGAVARTADIKVIVQEV